MYICSDFTKKGRHEMKQELIIQISHPEQKSEGWKSGLIVPICWNNKRNSGKCANHLEIDLCLMLTVIF